MILHGGGSSVLTPRAGEMQFGPSLRIRKLLKEGGDQSFVSDCTSDFSDSYLGMLTGWPQWQYFPNTVLEVSLSRFPLALTVCHIGWREENTTGAGGGGIGAKEAVIAWAEWTASHKKKRTEEFQEECALDSPSDVGHHLRF